jgi:hypothetical protein
VELVRPWGRRGDRGRRAGGGAWGLEAEEEEEGQQKETGRRHLRPLELRPPLLLAHSVQCSNWIWFWNFRRAVVSFYGRELV